MAELAGQLLFSPPAKREAQVRAAECLHDEVANEQTYPLDFVTYRITGYHPKGNDEDSLLLVGAGLRADLRLLIDSLSRSTDMTPAADESLETPQQLASRLGVSTKTIDRWRKTSLRWRWAVLPGEGRRQVVIPTAAVESMQARQGDKVRRATSFSRVDQAQRERMIERARRLIRDTRLSRHQIARRLALQIGRSPETIRAVLEKHDRQHPDDRIFPMEGGSLSDRHRRVVARALRRGIDVRKITARFGCSRSTVYRVVHEQRAQALRDRPIGYSTLPWFQEADPLLDQGEIGRTHLSALLDKHLPQPSEIVSSPDPGHVNTDELPDLLAALYQQPRADRETQRVLAIRMNFLWYQAARLRERLPKSNPRVGDLEAIDTALRHAARLREQLVRMNLPAVLATARRHVEGHEDRLLRLFDLLELGNRVLIDAVDQYDIARGRSLEWYATWRLMQRFVRERLKAETTLDGVLGDPLTRAHRREHPEHVYDRMLAQAKQRGVALIGPTMYETDAGHDHDHGHDNATGKRLDA